MSIPLVNPFTSLESAATPHPRLEFNLMEATDLMEATAEHTSLALVKAEEEALDAVLSSRCSAMSKQSGEQCKRRPIPGGNVCKIHGGGAPQVQARALENLRRARDAALDALNTSIDEYGERMDPRALLDIVTKLTDKVELLEGRATERRESSSKVEMEQRSLTIKASIDSKLDDVRRRIERQAEVIGEDLHA